ncbi:MAG: class I SAM-dependent methyltransferase [Candidatus Diapherotrites archaeon]|uniref:Class I SAM-dependent methyltransferase n=1 Tax=Candidatus Iainarchaeum sp. TaxID=3101447 RepID=A0A7J4L0T2_9ARCH|nr:class I SAM-dependent methyltransferase [Candidatus Diapherotrites archaeon]HIH33256.1 class I SAM-dependent methyltransferase [Candidatus Diapherotrites archaeon]
MKIRKASKNQGNLFTRDKKLRGLDYRTRLSNRTLGFAARRGKDISSHETADFGRTLNKYYRIFKALNQHLGSVKDKTILHFGSSTGVLTKHLQNRRAIAIGLDTSPEALDIAKLAKNKRLVKATAKLRGSAHKYLPFRDNSIDCIVSDHFLYSDYAELEGRSASGDNFPSRVLNSNLAMAEVFRVLKPNGIIVLHDFVVWPGFEFGVGQESSFKHFTDKLGFEILEAGDDIIVLRKK